MELVEFIKKIVRENDGCFPEEFEFAGEQFTKGDGEWENFANYALGMSKSICSERPEPSLPPSVLDCTLKGELHDIADGRYPYEVKMCDALPKSKQEGCISENNSIKAALRDATNSDYKGFYCIYNFADEAMYGLHHTHSSVKVTGKLEEGGFCEIIFCE